MEHQAIISSGLPAITGLLVTAERIYISLDTGTVELFDHAAQKQQTLRGHTGAIWRMCLVNSEQLLTGSTDTTVRLWNASTGELIRSFHGHINTVRGLALIDERTFVSASRDGTLRIWDIDSSDCKHVLQGHESTVRAMAICHTQIVSASYDKTARIWDADTGDLLQVFRGHTEKIYDVVFDGERIVTGSMDQSLRVWDPISGACIAVLEAHTSLVSILKLHENNLLSAGADGLMCHWNLEEKRLLNSIAPNDGAMVALDWVDGKQLLSAGNNGMVRLWRITNGKFAYEKEIGRKAEATWQVALHEGKAFSCNFIDNKPMLEIHSL